MPVVSRTNQCDAWRSSASSHARTCAASPAVFRIQVPSSSSWARSIRIASSRSRAIARGHQAAPLATIASTSAGSGAAGALTVIVAWRAARSTRTSTVG